MTELWKQVAEAVAYSLDILREMHDDDAMRVEFLSKYSDSMRALAAGDAPKPPEKGGDAVQVRCIRCGEMSAFYSWVDPPPTQTDGYPKCQPRPAIQPERRCGTCEHGRGRTHEMPCKACTRNVCSPQPYLENEADRQDRWQPRPADSLAEEMERVLHTEMEAQPDESGLGGGFRCIELNVDLWRDWVSRVRALQAERDNATRRAESWERDAHEKARRAEDEQRACASMAQRATEFEKRAGDWEAECKGRGRLINRLQHIMGSKNRAHAKFRAQTCGVEWKQRAEFAESQAEQATGTAMEAVGARAAAEAKVAELNLTIEDLRGDLGFQREKREEYYEEWMKARKQVAEFEAHLGRAVDGWDDPTPPGKWLRDAWVGPDGDRRNKLEVIARHLDGVKGAPAEPARITAPRELVEWVPGGESDAEADNS